MMARQRRCMIFMPRSVETGGSNGDGRAGRAAKAPACRPQESIKDWMRSRNHLDRLSRLTDDMMTLHGSLGKSSDADLFRVMVGFVGERLMVLEVEG